MNALMSTVLPIAHFPQQSRLATLNLRFADDGAPRRREEEVLM